VVVPGLFKEKAEVGGDGDGRGVDGEHREPGAGAQARAVDSGASTPLLPRNGTTAAVDKCGRLLYHMSNSWERRYSECHACKAGQKKNDMTTSGNAKGGQKAGTARKV
jgi:hypothetical protein